MRKILVGFVLTLGLLLMGCNTNRELSTDHIVLSDPLPRVASSDRLPYEDLTLSYGEREELHDAFNELARQCAAEYGLDLVLVVDHPPSLGDGGTMWNGRFGTLPLEHAKKYGYHTAPGQDGTKPFTIFVNEDEQPQRGVLDGVFNEGDKRLINEQGESVPQGGCRQKVANKIGGDPYRLGPVNAEDIRLAAMRDPRTQEAMNTWSECMREWGYEFSRIDEPADLALGNRLSEEEKTVATIDVECTQLSRWSDIAFALQKALQLESIAENEQQYLATLEAERRMLDQAKVLVKD